MASMYSSHVKAGVFDARLEKQRRCENHRDLLVRYVKDDRSAIEANSFLDRSDAYRRKREADQRVAELLREEEAKKQERSKKASELASEDDAWIAKALEEKNTGIEREKRVQFHLINESPEIKELRRKLQIAEVTRERHQQKREKLIIELEKTARNVAFHAVMEKQLAEEERKEHESRQHQQLLQLVMKQRLDQQMQEKEIEKRKLVEEKMQEHMAVDKLIFEVEEEQNRDAKIKSCMQAKQRRQMMEHLYEKEKMKLKKAEEEKSEERKIENYKKKLQDRIAENEAKLKEKKEKDERIHAVLSAGKLEDVRRKEELENIINEYYFEQAESEYQKKQEELQMQRERVRANLKAVSDFYQALKEKQKWQEKVEREEFQRTMLTKLAEEHKIEQLNDQKRRMKVEEYKREIEKLWQVKQAAFEAQIEEAKKNNIREEKEAIEMEAAIEAERQRLLAEHGKRLAHFLPPGTLKNMEDLKLVGLQP